MRSRIAARFAALFATVAVLLAMAAMPATAAHRLGGIESAPC